MTMGWFGSGLLVLMHSMTESTQKIYNMKIKPLKTKKDYQQAMNRMESIFDARPGTPEGDELEILGILVEKYEAVHYPIDFPDPIEAIKFRMEQLGFNQKDLANIIGFKSRVSEIMNGKRKLSLDMIRKINTRLNISTDVLIKEY
jgi:HTH-type transcriptional regulator/antitoxin HigA